ncbi:MAG: hypothetical protein IPK26_12440 [Planctomycetes bacterium]|nr:hypothetical protein [Planctomycetota bacterium]
MPLPVSLPWLLLMLSTVASAQSFFESARRADGSWPVVDHGGRPEAELRVQALVVLMYVNDGSNSRSGPWREIVRPSVAWLQRTQDRQGRLGLRSDPDWLLDHAFATCALVEHARHAGWQARKNWSSALAAVAALRVQLGYQRHGIAAELALWTRWIAMALAAASRSVGNAREVVAPTLEAAACQLRTALALQRLQHPESVRDRAAAFLLAEVTGWQSMRLSVAPWPEDPVAEPLAAFYVLLARFRIGGHPWMPASRWARQQLVRKFGAGEPAHLRDTLAPTGAFGAENGRIGTTAAGILATTVYYRYCRFALLED